MPDRSPPIIQESASRGPADNGQANARLMDMYRPFHERYYGLFYKYARGHILNRYNVSLTGPYVEEALRVMDLNTNIDRNLKTKKLSHGFPFKHEAFKQWLDIHYDSKNYLLNMLWVSQDVSINPAKGNPTQVVIDTIKNTMPYPVITKYSGPEELTLKVIDDPYFMWYQFFNALFNVQFSTRVLKARSTFQKILVCVDVYGEMTTAIGNPSNETKRTNKIYYTTDDLAQSFEFNSCVLLSAPKMGILKNQENGDLYQFDLHFKFPNAFQGTSKSELRGLRDNTIEGSLAVGNGGVDGEIGCFNRSFFEEGRPNRKTNINTATEQESLNAISHTYYDKSFKDKLLPPFKRLPTNLQLYPERQPAGQPIKNKKPKDSSPEKQKTASTASNAQQTTPASNSSQNGNYMERANEIYPVSDWKNYKQDAAKISNTNQPVMYSEPKAATTENSAASWAGVPYK